MYTGTMDPRTEPIFTDVCHPNIKCDPAFSTLMFRQKDKSELDVVRENHRFLWSADDEKDMTW